VASWRFFSPAWLEGQRDPAALIEQWIGYWTTRALWRQLVAGVDELGEPADKLTAISPEMREEIARAAVETTADGRVVDPEYAVDPAFVKVRNEAMRAAQTGGAVKRMTLTPAGPVTETRALAANIGDLGAGYARAADLAPLYPPAALLDHPTAEAEASYEALKRRWRALLGWGAATRAPETQGQIVAWDHFSTEWESFTGHADAAGLRGQEEALRNAEANAAAHGYVPPSSAAPVHTPDPDRASAHTVAAHQVDDAARAAEEAARRAAESTASALTPWLIGGALLGMLGLGAVVAVRR
jgi:hypothetical protein